MVRPSWPHGELGGRAIAAEIVAGPIFYRFLMSADAPTANAETLVDALLTGRRMP